MRRSAPTIEDHMRHPLRLAPAMRHVAAALAAMTVCSAWADDAPLARILITPSVMSETGGGSVDVLEVFPDMSAEAGARLLSIDNFSPGLSMPQRMENFTVTDDRGPVALSPNQTDHPNSWTASRKVRGTLTIHYRLPVVNDTHATGGPQGSPRIDGDGISSTGEMPLMQPVTNRPGANMTNSPVPYEVKSNSAQSLSMEYDYHQVTFRAGIQDIGDSLPSFPTRSYGDIVGTQFFVGVHAKIL